VRVGTGQSFDGARQFYFQMPFFAFSVFSGRVFTRELSLKHRERIGLASDYPVRWWARQRARPSKEYCPMCGTDSGVRLAALS